MARSTVKTAQVNPAKLSKAAMVETQVTEVPGYLTATQASKIQKQEHESFITAFQSQVTVEVADITFAQLDEAFNDTQDEFEQAETDKRSVKKIAQSVALGDSGLMKPITVTEFDGVLYVTGGRHRTEAVLYIALEVMGLEAEDDIRVIYQTVTSYHQLVELIEADNAGRRMRSAELSTIQSQLLGVSKEMSLEEALEHLFAQKATRSQLRKSINSLVVRENRRTENSPLTDEGTRTMVNYLTAILFEREYDVDAYAKTLTAYYDYIVANYNKLAKLVEAEFNDNNVIRHGKFVAEKVIEALKLNKVINKLRTQAEVKEEKQELAEQTRLEKEQAKAEKIVAENAEVSDDAPKGGKRKAGQPIAQAPKPQVQRTARKVAPKAEVEVEAEVEEDEVDEVEPKVVAKKGQRQATQLKAVARRI